MTSTLIEGGVVATMDAGRSRYDHGWVLVRDGVIAGVGDAPTRPDAADVDERIDAGGCIVVPGLVNAHQHHWYSLFKGLGAGMLLEQWISDLLLPAGAALTSADLEIASWLSCLEMLGGGTTTCLNHSVTRSDDAAVAATLQPVVESGMRQLFAKEVRPDGLEDELALAQALHGRWNGAANGRIALGLVVETSAHWVAVGACSEELVLRADALAARLGMRVSDHIAGGTMSREHGYLRFVLETGRTDVEYLHQLGVLDDKWVLAHALNARDRDIELTAASGATVVHTPTSEASRGAGIAPIRRYRDAGARVALGSDGPMVDTSVDMIEQMKATILLQNQLHLDPSAVVAEDALAMATIEAAAALGLDAQIGSLEPGKRADVAVFDLEQPHCAVHHDPVAALVHSARGSDVRWVLVDGEPLVREGAFVRHDRDAVRAIVGEARARAHELLARADVPAHHAAAARRALPTPA